MAGRADENRRTKAAPVWLVGGGTGGHVFPAIAVAAELKQLVPNPVQLIVARRRRDRQWADGATCPVRQVFAAPFPYGLRPLALMRAAAAGAAGLAQSLAWALGNRPAAALLFGGYVSVPPGLAARLLSVRIVLHVADALPDRTSRVLARWARAVTVNYPEAAEHFGGCEVIVTGQPIRPWLLGADRAEACRRLGLSPDRPTLLVMGGSQGARSINLAMAGAAPAILDQTPLQVIHLCGARDYEALREQLSPALESGRYKLIAFLREMQWALAAADLAVTRAGANGLAELAAAGVAMIAVPYPHAGGHQLYNALPLQRAGAAVILRDEELTADRLAQQICALAGNRSRLERMQAAARRWARPDAARAVAEVVASRLREHR